MTNASIFFTFSVLCLVTIVAVFALKYLTAAHREKLAGARQSATDATVENLRQDVASLTRRVASLEKLLRDVE